MKTLITLTSFAVLLFIQPAIADHHGAGKAVFESKCGLCHGIDRPLSKNKTKEEWTKTVERMRSKASDKFTDEDVKLIIEWLSVERPM